MIIQAFIVAAATSAEPSAHTSQAMYEAAVAAYRTGDHVRAAEGLYRLAHRDDRGGHRRDLLVFRAVNVWLEHFRGTSSAESLCAGREALEWYLTSTETPAAPLVRQYTEVNHKLALSGASCTRRIASRPARSEQVRRPEDATAEASEVNPESADSVARPRPISTAGWVLTALGGGSLVASATSAILLQTKLRPYREGEPIADEPQYYREAKLLEGATIATGVVGGVALVTGVVMLVVDRRQQRRLSVQPVASPTFAGIHFASRF